MAAARLMNEMEDRGPVPVHDPSSQPERLPESSREPPQRADPGLISKTPRTPEGCQKHWLLLNFPSLPPPSRLRLWEHGWKKGNHGDGHR